MDPNLAGFAAAMATSEPPHHSSPYLEQQHYHQHQHRPQEQQQQYQHQHHQQLPLPQHPSYCGSTESSLEQAYAIAPVLPQNPTVAAGPTEHHPADQPYNPAAPQAHPHPHPHPHLHPHPHPAAAVPPLAAMMPHPPVGSWGGVAASSLPFPPPSLAPPHNFLPAHGPDMPPGVDPAHHLPSHYVWHDELHAQHQQHLPPQHQPHPLHHHHQQHVLHQLQPHHPHHHPWMQPVPGLQGGAMPRPGMAVPRFNSTIGMAKRPAKVWPKKLKKSSIKKPLSDKPDKTTQAAPKEKAPKSKSAFCTLCHLDCTTEFALQQHVNGKRHKRQLQRQEENGRKAGDKGATVPAGSKGPVTNVRGKAGVPVAAIPDEAVANVRGKAAVSVAAVPAETVTSAQGESTVSVVGGNIANVLEQMWLQVSMMGKGHKSGKSRGRGRKRPRSEMTGEGKFDSTDVVERGDATIKASRSEMIGEGEIDNKAAVERGDATIKAENGFVEATPTGEKDSADAMTGDGKRSADERTEDEKCSADARTECGKGSVDATPDGERGFTYARTGNEKETAEARAVSEYLMNAMRADESNVTNTSQDEGKFIPGVKVDSEEKDFPNAYDQSKDKGFAITAFEGEEKNVLSTTEYKQEEKNVLSTIAYEQDETDSLHVSFEVEQGKVASLAAENAFGSARPGPSSPSKQQEQTKCELCNIQCQTKAVLESHLAGKKHANRLRLSQIT